MPKKISEISEISENSKIESVLPRPIIPKAYDVKEGLSQKAEEMKAQLDKQPKVSILIPLERGEKKGTVQPFTLNGYRLTVPKGVMTMVPEQIADMVAERFNVELDIRGRSLDNREQDVRNALQ